MFQILNFPWRCSSYKNCACSQFL